MAKSPKTTLCIFLVVGFLLAPILPLQAGMQISDEFRRVAKKIAKEWAAREFREVCRGQEQGRLVCEALVDGLADVFLLAVDGETSNEAIDGALRRMFGRIARAGALDAAKRMLNEVIKEASPCIKQRISGFGDSESFTPNLLNCLLGMAYRGADNAEHECKAIWENLHHLMEKPLPSKKITKKDLLAILDDFIKQISVSDPDLIKARVLLTKLYLFTKLLGEGDVYSMALAVEKRHEKSLNELGYTWGHDIFDDQYISNLIELAKKAKCQAETGILPSLQTWEDERGSVLYLIGLSLSRLKKPDQKILGRIPFNLDDSGCEETSETFRRKIKELNRFGSFYKANIDITAEFEKFAMPALLVGLLVDYAESEDEEQLEKHLIDFTLRVLARTIAAYDQPGYWCEEEESEPGVYSCTCITDSEDVREIECPFQKKEQNDEYIKKLFEYRNSPEAAHQTCLYQAVSFLLQPTGEPMYIPKGICRRIHVGQKHRRLIDSNDAFYRNMLTDLNDELARWNDNVSIEVDDRMTLLRFPDEVTLDSAYNLISLLMEGLYHFDGDSIGARHIIRNLFEIYQAMKAGDHEGARVNLMKTAGKYMVKVIKDQLDNQLGGLEQCTSKNERGSPELGCGVRMLAEPLIDSFVEYLSIDDPGSFNRRQVIQDVLLRLDEIDPMSHTPLLFNVGLGYTMLVGPNDEDAEDNVSHHCTLIDKFGIALQRWGYRNQWEWGLFAGGFLDAIIRGAPDESEETYWLLGSNIGIREFWPGYPVGLEAHVGGAIPFNLEDSELGFVLGLSLILPLEYVFED